MLWCCLAVHHYISVSGVTCGGKTTLAKELKKVIPSTITISQDDYFFDDDDPRHTWIKELNHVNYDIISSLDMEKMLKDVTAILSQFKTVKFQLELEGSKNGMNNDLVSNIHSRLKETDTQILLLEGFCIFNYKPLCDLCSLKYYFTLNEEECYKRRTQRVYIPPDCPGYFEKCVWPEYLNLYQYVQENVKDVVYFDGTLPQPIGNILVDIYKTLQCLSNE
ncbi:hypothetical protein FQR65_LT05759 [Abscondita terminalis]|nr:hypothetical protein FQR65_LT05759 [Abscondita terminalis]